MPNQPHTFHIPVMGTGFTIDTPLKVAQYGISSVVSLVDDMLIEQVRKYHCERLGLPYQPIKAHEEDARARRITAYLDLLDTLVANDTRALSQTPFEPGSPIVRYFEMLPESALKDDYRAMLNMEEGEDRAMAQQALRQRITSGRIDVNIMTKLDGDAYNNGSRLPVEYCSAMAALRGFAKSRLSSAVVFSAGFNRRLYSYAAQFEDFTPSAGGEVKKKIVLKVSDFRSALVQGKFLAKMGLWVSEFRIESGLNCGGHAFATAGYLLGPVLNEFLQRRSELVGSLGQAFMQGMQAKGRQVDNLPADPCITVQGGIGNADEDRFLIQHYHLDGTGWGSPFLLVPEATNMDQEHLDKLIQAQSGDVYLSGSSPLGVPFWMLRSSAGEIERMERISQGRPGSPCKKRFAALSTEFSKVPLCPASSAYIKQKLENLAQENCSEDKRSRLKESILSKSCLCSVLAGSTTKNYHIEDDAKPAICCGPNIVNFKRIASLQEMVDHIYGRIRLDVNPQRPHMFIQELKLYLEHLSNEISLLSHDLTQRPKGYLQSFKDQLFTGIEYYRDLAKQSFEQQKEAFLEELKALHKELEKMALPG